MPELNIYYSHVESNIVFILSFYIVDITVLIIILFYNILIVDTDELILFSSTSARVFGCSL